MQFDSKLDTLTLYEAYLPLGYVSMHSTYTEKCFTKKNVCAWLKFCLLLSLPTLHTQQRRALNNHLTDAHFHVYFRSLTDISKDRSAIESENNTVVRHFGQYLSKTHKGQLQIIHEPPYLSQRRETLWNE